MSLSPTLEAGERKGSRSSEVAAVPVRKRSAPWWRRSNRLTRLAGRRPLATHVLILATETPACAAAWVTVRSSGGAFGPRVDRSSLDRFNTADEVAGAVAILIGSDANFITGHTLTFDG